MANPSSPSSVQKIGKTREKRFGFKELFISPRNTSILTNNSLMLYSGPITRSLRPNNNQLKFNGLDPFHVKIRFGLKIFDQIAACLRWNMVSL
jgi:hypothetical protein